MDVVGVSSKLGPEYRFVGSATTKAGGVAPPHGRLDWGSLHYKLNTELSSKLMI